MAIVNFIPELWAAQMQEQWDAEKVFAALCDRQYEGIAARGNKVHITGVVAPAVKDYKAAGRTTTADAITDTGVDLLIDQEKSFDFYVDDIDEVQAAGSLEPYTRAAGNALVNDGDQFLARLIVNGGNALPGATPANGNDAFNLIRDARKQLNKLNAPATGRVLVCNAEFEGLLLGADSKLTSFDTSGDNQGLRAATIGALLGFRVITSNNMPESDDPQFAAFHPEAAAFVSQIDKVEAMRADNKFADRVRGLHVYGGNLVRPDGLVVFGGSSEWTVTINGGPSGGTFTLTVGGQTTAGIAYNATATVVRNALTALSTVGTGNATVTGSAGAYQVILSHGGTLTGDGAGLTGGTSPAVVIAAA